MFENIMNSNWKKSFSLIVLSVAITREAYGLKSLKPSAGAHAGGGAPRAVQDLRRLRPPGNAAVRPLASPPSRGRGGDARLP